MILKSFKQLQQEKLTPAMKNWIKKKGRKGDIYKFIVRKRKDLFILNYKND